MLASQITTGKFETRGPADDPVGERKVVRAWTLGRVVDGNQSKNMVTLCVGVAPVVEEGGLSVDQMLDHAWLDHRKKSHTAKLDAIAQALDRFRLSTPAWVQEQLDVD